MVLISSVIPKTVVSVKVVIVPVAIAMVEAVVVAVTMGGDVAVVCSKLLNGMAIKSMVVRIIIMVPMTGVSEL